VFGPGWKPGAHPDVLAHGRNSIEGSNRRSNRQARMGAKDGNKRKAGPG